MWVFGKTIKKQDMQDDKIKDLLSGTKIKAGENLKFRIMQQIETENALSRKKVTNTRPILGNMLTIFGVMYLLIAIVAKEVRFLCTVALLLHTR